MKTKCLISICLIITLISLVGCRKKSQPAQEQPAPPTEITQESKNEQFLPDETEYYALFLEGKKIGYAIQNREVSGSKVTTSVDLKITLNRAGVSVSIQTKAATFETTDGKPLGFEVDNNYGFMSTKTTGTINDMGKLIVSTGQQQTELDWPQGAVMSEGTRL
ncbi:MAG: hypothetical protein JW715_03655, partial [Sedimentisphaerales bacterium]|nr:hypothetical protein [Sedimentisphaerales bacterium]